MLRHAPLPPRGGALPARRRPAAARGPRGHARRHRAAHGGARLLRLRLSRSQGLPCRHDAPRRARRRAPQAAGARGDAPPLPRVGDVRARGRARRADRARRLHGQPLDQAALQARARLRVQRVRRAAAARGVGRRLLERPRVEGLSPLGVCARGGRGVRNPRARARVCTCVYGVFLEKTLHASAIHTHAPMRYCRGVA